MPARVFSLLPSGGESGLSQTSSSHSFHPVPAAQAGPQHVVGQDAVPKVGSDDVQHRAVVPKLVPDRPHLADGEFRVGCLGDAVRSARTLLGEGGRGHDQADRTVPEGGDQVVAIAAQDASTSHLAGGRRPVALRYSWISRA